MSAHSLAPLAAASVAAPVLALCRAIAAAGGRAWLVGGWVRDALLADGRQPSSTDYDLEVYGLDWEALRALAERFGRVTPVGKQFAVLKLTGGGVVMDLALPRRERSSGTGHRDFAVVADPDMTPRQASSRRDFTINAMMYDPLCSELLDFYGGRADLKAGVLRHVGEAFSDDPLRPLRGMQFCARLNGVLAEETARCCRRMVALASALPVARVWQEWRKWARSAYPDAGLRALADSGWLACYPPLQRLPATPQDPRWHPEGDVWQHTLQVCRQAARIALREEMAEEGRLVLLFAALCHDLGKPETTAVGADGAIHSRGHAEAGSVATAALLRMIGAPKWLREQVTPLVREHLVHLHGEPTERAVRRLASRLQPATIAMWEHLIEADASGRAPNPPDRPAKGWLQVAEAMRVTRKPPRPLLTGKWLLRQGMEPGPAMGAVLKAAWQAQLDGEIATVDDAERWWRERGLLLRTEERGRRSRPNAAGET